MMPLLLPSRYTQQPQQAAQIDWSNPITQGLSLAYAAGPTAAMGFSEADAPVLPYTTSGGTTVGASIPTPIGLAVKSLSTSSYSFTVSGLTKFSSSANYSLFAVGTGPGSGTQNAIDDDDGNSRKFQFRINAGKVEFIPFNTGGTVIGTASASAAMTAAQLTRGFTMGATASTSSIAAFQNGIKSSTFAGTGLATPNSSLFIGNRKTGSTNGWLVGGLALVAAWSRTLSDAEMQSLAANPWQIFKMPTRRLWYATTSASDATGALAATLDDAAFIASGQIVAQGAFASTLSDAAFTTSGTVGDAPAGSIASALAGASMTFTGSVTNTGVLANTLDGASIAASGIVTNRSTFASTLEGATFAASGAVNANVSGSLASTLDGATFAAGGYVGTPPAGPDFFIRLPKNPRHVIHH